MVERLAGRSGLAALVAAQGAALAVVGLLFGIDVAGGSPDHPAAAGVLAAIVVVAGLLLAYLAGRIRVGRRWAYSPVLLAELLAIVSASGRFQAHQWGRGLLIGLPAVVAVVWLLATRPRD